MVLGFVPSGRSISGFHFLRLFLELELVPQIEKLVIQK